MKPRLLPLAAALLAAGAAAAQDTGREDAPTAVPPRPGLEHVLPPDTFFYVGAADVDAALQGLRATAAGRWWVDPENGPWRAAVSNLVKALGARAVEATGADPTQLPSMAHGRFALAASGDFVRAIEHDGPAGLTLSMLADVGAEHEACQVIVSQLEDKLAEDSTCVRKTEEIGGTEVTTFEDARLSAKRPGRLSIAFQGETLVVMAEFLPQDGDPLGAVLARLDGEPGPSLADQPRFRDSLASRPASAQLWLDARVLGSIVRLKAEQEMHGPAAEPEPPAASSGGRSHADARAVFELLDRSGLFELNGFSIATQWSTTGARLQASLDWPGAGWLPALGRLLIAPSDTRMLAALPAPGLIAAVSAHTEFAALFDRVMEVIVSSGRMPPSAATDMLAGAEKALGFNPRDDLLDALDGRLGFAVYQAAPGEGLVNGDASVPWNLVLLVGLQDSEQVRSLVEDLIGKSPLHALRTRADVEGFETYALPVEPQFSIHYALLSDVAILSPSATLLHDVLRHRLGQQDTRSLTDDALFKQRLMQLDGPASVYWYAPASQLLQGFLKGLGEARQVASAESKDASSDEDANPVLQFLRDMPPLDEAAIRRHFPGGCLTTLAMDEHGLLLQSVSP